MKRLGVEEQRQVNGGWCIRSTGRFSRFVHIRGRYYHNDWYRYKSGKWYYYGY